VGCGVWGVGCGVWGVELEGWGEGRDLPLLGDGQRPPEKPRADEMERVATRGGGGRQTQ
jgi:hypothetical protein